MMQSYETLEVAITDFQFRSIIMVDTGTFIQVILVNNMRDIIIYDIYIYI